MANKPTFEFRIGQVFPIGLHNDGQRAIHTILHGYILSGSLKEGNALWVMLKDGSVYQARTKGVMLAIKGSLPKMINAISFEEHGEFTCDIAFCLHPGKADLVDIDKPAWSETAIS